MQDTYPILIKNMRSNLIGDPLIGPTVTVMLPIRGSEPVSGRYSSAVIVCNVPLRDAVLGQLANV
jgi:hypothetical protein